MAARVGDCVQQKADTFSSLSSLENDNAQLNQHAVDLLVADGGTSFLSMCFAALARPNLMSIGCLSILWASTIHDSSALSGP